VLRREREISQALQQSSESRRFATEVQQTLQPYMGMIQAEGGTPVRAIAELNTLYRRVSWIPYFSKHYIDIHGQSVASCLIIVIISYDIYGIVNNLTYLIHYFTIILSRMSL